MVELPLFGLVIRSMKSTLLTEDDLGRRSRGVGRGRSSLSMNATSSLAT